MVFVNEKIGDLWRSVNKETGEYLLYKGKVGESPYDFQLIRDGRVIDFSASLYLERVKNEKEKVYWRVVALYIPENDPDKGEIRKRISEAMEACGAIFSWQNVEEVKTIFKI